MLRVSYAESLNPDDARIEKILSKLEAVTEIKADRVSPNNPLGFIGELLYRAEAANDSMEYDRVKQILANILYLAPNNTVALERLGSVDYITKDYAQAVKAWEKALPNETSPEETASLKNYLQLAKDALAHPQASSLPVSTEKQVQRATQPPTTQNAPAAPAPQITSRDRAEIARLYKQGVDDYAAGNYLSATAEFLKILEIDPNNAEANKALERINQVRGRQ
jgi:tetratricopeptide (TPR) repeat protein